LRDLLVHPGKQKGTAVDRVRPQRRRTGSDELPMTTEPEPAIRRELTVTEAAKAAGVDRRMITRRLDAEMFPNAYRSDGKSGPGSGPWMIPTGDLIAAGLQLHLPSSPDEPEPTVSEVEMLRLEIDLLRQRLVDKDAHLTDARAALAMALQQFGASPSPTSTTNSEGPEQAAEPAAAPVTAFDMLDSSGPLFWADPLERVKQRPKWLRRLFGDD